MSSADAPGDDGRQRDRAYWLGRPPAGRLAEGERLRRERYGPDYDAGPMEKVGWIKRSGSDTFVRLPTDAP